MGGKGRGKGSRHYDPEVRTDELERRFREPPSHTSHNATHFVFALYLVIRGFIRMTVDQLQYLEAPTMHIGQV